MSVNGFELPIYGEKQIDSKLSLTINGTVIRDYVKDYSVEIQEEYDTENQFEAIDGTKYDMYLGSRRILSVNFEPMTTSQINTLFNAIKSNVDESTNRPIQEISYIDPQNGNSTKTFVCNNLPAATYFESGEEVYWNVPTITFTEFNIDKSGGQGGENKYKYKIEIGSMEFKENEISKDTNISMSISANGYDVGQIASCCINGSVLCKYSAIIRRNDKVKAYVSINDGEWQLIHAWFLKSANKNNSNILSFTALDSLAFLDNNYYVQYERDEDGEIIPQTISGHLSAIGSMIGTLAGESSIPIPYYCDNVQISPNGNTNARTMVQNAGASGAVNYRQRISSDNIYIETFKLGEETYSISSDECGEFSTGFAGETINNIILYCGSVSELPNKIFPEMYKYYNIYIVGAIPSGQYPVAKNTLEINAQLAPMSAAAEHNNFENLLGANFGTEFSVNNVKMRYFISVGTRIYLPNVSEDYYTYATSINYTLSENGVFASISGSARDISDSYYLGGMEKDMQNRIKIDENYNNVMIGKEGLFLVSPKGDE